LSRLIYQHQTLCYLGLLCRWNTLFIASVLYTIDICMSTAGLPNSYLPLTGSLLCVFVVSRFTVTWQN